MEFSQVYIQYKPLLFSIAYRMLGLVQDAEDIVQDIFVNLQQGQNEVRDIKAYLTRAVTNRCINEIKSSRRTRTDYIGPWLPEPIVEPVVADPALLFQRRDDIDFAFLVLLETLSPAERAVFVLRETLDYPFNEIAGLIDKSPTNCRKLLSRAKLKITRLRQDDPGQHSGGPDRPELARSFSRALLVGDMAALMKLLSSDTVLTTDSGGKVKSAINPIYGRERVLALLTFSRTNRLKGAKLIEQRINGRVGFSFLLEGGSTYLYTFAYTADGTAISHVYLIMNPDKLQGTRLK